VQPTVCVLTVIGSCHLENLGDLDGVLKAKTEMFSNARENASFVLNGDDDKLSEIKDINGQKPIFYGLMAENPYHAENVKNNAEQGVSCTLCFKDKKLNVTIPAIGSYMVSNALAATAVGDLLGLSDEQLIEGVQAYQTVGSRANVVQTKKIRIIDDCYNANPNSMRASIDTLKNFDGRKVAILGDMKELGAYEAKLHYQTGQYAKAQGVDLIIGVGPLALELAKGAEGLWFATIEDLEADINSLIKNKDTVLVKASHSMHFEKIVESLKYF
ncbi:MAG: UDP-N-acetylmuramoyl-tripeptide--D-alanyl-D-alanine ligase, partial [Ruminococcus sp.]|nr:UDP-N-acetylmuramoyl-tripeptide--D-alanyl-D-alanine ligase [Ruminococcus sp.]